MRKLGVSACLFVLILASKTWVDLPNFRDFLFLLKKNETLVVHPGIIWGMDSPKMIDATLQKASFRFQSITVGLILGYIYSSNVVSPLKKQMKKKT